MCVGDVDPGGVDPGDVDPGDVRGVDAGDVGSSADVFLFRAR